MKPGSLEYQALRKENALLRDLMRCYEVLAGLIRFYKASTQ